MSGKDLLTERIRSVLLSSGIDTASAQAAAQAIQRNKRITGTLAERYPEQLHVHESEVKNTWKRTLDRN